MAKFLLHIDSLHWHETLNFNNSKSIPTGINQKCLVSSPPCLRVASDHSSLSSTGRPSPTQLRSRIEHLISRTEKISKALHYLDIQKGENEHSIRDNNTHIEELKKKLALLQPSSALEINKYRQKIQQSENTMNALNLKNSALEEKIFPLQEELAQLKNELMQLETELIVLDPHYKPNIY